MVLFFSVQFHMHIKNGKSRANNTLVRHVLTLLYQQKVFNSI